MLLIVLVLTYFIGWYLFGAPLSIRAFVAISFTPTAAILIVALSRWLLEKIGK
jgi:hypothetical protein